MKIYKLVLIVLLVASAFGWAQDDAYKIGINDVLTISFWQEPDLNSEVRVGEDGKITLPVIGEIEAAGYTTAQLAKNIVKQMSFYNPGISQATVVVSQFNSQTVVLNGAVNTPGEYNFEKIPNLLDVIREAGGALPNADLSAVTIVRQENGKVKVINVDLLKHIQNGDLAGLPRLLPKDLVNVPFSPYGNVTDVFGGQTFKGKKVYFIYGAVTQPGVKSLSEDIELTDAIAAAGGPTAEADLKKVKVVIKDVQYSSVLNFNLEKYTKTGRPIRYRLHPEDMIVVPFRSQGSFWSRLPELIVPSLASALVTTVITTIIVDALSDNNSSSANQE